MVAIGGMAGLAVGLAAVYGIGALQRNAADAACAPAVELAQRLAPLARGEVAAFAVTDRSLRLPDLDQFGITSKGIMKSLFACRS